MIAWLSGTLVEADAGTLVLNVGGVGHEVSVTTAAAAALPMSGEPLTLFVHQVVREDALALFGFMQRQERDLFRSLIRANGVGPRLALAILSTLTVAELAEAVQSQAPARLTAVAGVGKKTAERLLIELKGKLDGFAAAAAPGVASGSAAPVGPVGDEALRALLKLGYRPAEAQQMLERSGAGSASTVEEQVRQALRSQLR